MLRALFSAIALLALAAPAHADDAKPQRIVSTNLCTDQIVLLLVERERIASLSSRTADPDVSNVVDLAAGIPVNDGKVEEVAAIAPDLVITDYFWNARTSAFMASLGIKVHGVPWANSVAEIRIVIRDIAGAVGERARGEAVIAAMDAKLDAITARAASKTVVPSLIYSPNGITAGRTSLENEIMGRLRLDNLAVSAGYDYTSAMSLEQVVSLKPRLLVIDAHREGGDSFAERLLRHPAIESLSHMEQVWLPSRLWLCPGPWVAEAAEILDRAGDAVRAKPPNA